MSVVPAGSGYPAVTRVRNYQGLADAQLVL